MEIKTTAIIGMGALGLMYGTHMMDAEPDTVTYVMDDARVQKYSGCTFYKNEKPYQLCLCSSETAAPADLVMVAVKYNSLASALETMKHCVGPDTIIMSVMNGITSEEIIAERFGKEHMIYTVAQGMDAMKFGDKLTYTRMGELHIGARDRAQEKNATAVRQYFERIHMPYVQDADILYRIWSKFMLNVGVNQTCMVYETNYGGCLEAGEPNRTMIAAMREVTVLAQQEGIMVGEKELNEYVNILKTLDPKGMPSMRQDGLAHRRSEVEMFAGTVIALARKHDILVPANEFLYKQVKEKEAGYPAV